MLSSCASVSQTSDYSNQFSRKFYRFWQDLKHLNQLSFFLNSKEHPLILLIIKCKKSRFNKTSEIRKNFCCIKLRWNNQNTNQDDSKESSGGLNEKMSKNKINSRGFVVEKYLAQNTKRNNIKRKFFYRRLSQSRFGNSKLASM